MQDGVGSRISWGEAEALRSLLEVSVNLAAMADWRRMLDLILRESRKLVVAEAGSLYVVRRKHLVFAAAQNDRMHVSEIERTLLNKEMPISYESLAGFVASTGQVMNIPDTHRLPPGAPFRISRHFDAVTGYRAESLLAIPLKCPDGQCMGVLELINCLDASGATVAFPDEEGGAIHSMAAMAAVTIHNAMLKEELKQAQLDTVIRLSVAAEYRDNATAEHLRRISRTSAAIARQLGLPASEVELIQCASPMHDIGKIGIPDAILRKPGPLTDDERRILEQHSVIGGEILGEPTNELIAMARDVALTHHERWDGSGYPRRLKGEEIPLSGRIVGLADVFDALVSKRCYKEAMPADAAIEVVRKEEGRHFDPSVASAFFDAMSTLLEAYPTAAPADDPQGR